MSLDKEKSYNNQLPCNCCFPFGLNFRLWHPTEDPVSSAINNIQESELQNNHSNLAKITLPISINYNSRPRHIGLLDIPFFGNLIFNNELLNLDRNLEQIIVKEKPNEPDNMKSNLSKNDTTKRATALYCNAYINGVKIPLIIDFGSAECIISLKLLKDLDMEITQASKTIMVNVNGEKRRPLEA
ncbi:10891_t:CDS:2, partial [Funneliformis geosporum]